MNIKCEGCENMFTYVQKSKVTKTFCPTCVKLRNAAAKRRYQKKRNSTSATAERKRVKELLDSIPDATPHKMIEAALQKIDRGH